MTQDGTFIFARYAELSREAGTMMMSLAVEDDGDRTNFPRLQGKSGNIEAVWSLEMALLRGTGYREAYFDGRQLVEVRFAEQPWPTTSFGSEVNFNGISADQIALRRARRILLNEVPEMSSELGSFSAARMNETMLETYVSGEHGGTVAVKASPIPGSFQGNSEKEAIEVARLISVFSLLATHTVQRVTRLEMRRVAQGVAIDFSGVRERRASNVDPTVLTVIGICPIP